MKIEIGSMHKLEAHPIDQGLFNQALSFFNAGTRCAAGIGITPTIMNAPMAPAVVCFAFALELYLKLLHIIATGNQIRGHKIDELYDSLPEDIKERVVRAYGNPDLTEHLKAASNSFVEWRYQHEHEALSVNPDLLASACRACHIVARSLRPELLVFGENHTVGVQT